MGEGETERESGRRRRDRERQLGRRGSDRERSGCRRRGERWSKKDEVRTRLRNGIKRRERREE